jgi:hypothetical protein
VFLLLCVLFQIVSGIFLIFRAGFFKKSFYEIVQIISGLYLSFFMINHARAVLMARYVWKSDPDFYFASGVAVRYPEKLFFIPYYTLSVVSVFAHIACAHYARRIESFEGDFNLFITNIDEEIPTGIIRYFYRRVNYYGFNYDLLHWRIVSALTDNILNLIGEVSGYAISP